jgi:hypothetical protein
MGLAVQCDELVTDASAAKLVHHRVPTKVDRVVRIHHKNAVTRATFEGCSLWVSFRRETCAFKEIFCSVVPHRSPTGQGGSGRFGLDSGAIADESFAGAA